MISPVLAQVDIEKEFKPPFKSIGDLISTLLPNIYLIAGIILFVLLIAGGLGIIVNAGKGDKNGVAKGGQLLTAALIGFLVIIGSYWIIQIISTVTGLNILRPEV